MNQKGREKEGSEEKRGDKGRTLLCLSSPPNATHVSGLGNNESRSQWDCRHYRVRAGSVCERWLCQRLLFNRWLLLCDKVTFHHLLLWAAFWTVPRWCDVLSDVTTARLVPREKHTCTGVHRAYIDLWSVTIRWAELYFTDTHIKRSITKHIDTRSPCQAFTCFFPLWWSFYSLVQLANWQWKAC